MSAEQLIVDCVLHTIWELLERGAADQNDAPAVLAPGAVALSFRDIRDTVQRAAKG
jgi:hypothetical protein